VKLKLPSLSEVRKAAAAAVAGVTLIVATGQLNGYTTALAVCNDIIAVGQLIAVYGIRNGAKP